MNWDFKNLHLTRKHSLTENASTYASDLLPTYHNFEFGSHFSTTWKKADRPAPSQRELLTKGGVICQQKSSLAANNQGTP